MTPSRTEVFKCVGEVELTIDLYDPQREPTGASILFFFGGGWRGGSTAQFHPHCGELAARGLLAACANYRVLADESRQARDPFDCVADGKSAVRWLRARVADLGLDPSRVAAGGGSAGGHVAAAAGLIPGLDEEGEDLSVSSVPDALLLFNPVIDTTPTGWKPGAQMLGERAEELSPAHHVRAGAPPTLLFHGTADATVPYENAERFARIMTGAGNRCELVGTEGAGHGFFNHGRDDGSAYRTTLARSVDFLADLGWVAPD